MIEYEQLHHVSLVVKDLPQCKKFYGEVLGLKELERPNFDFPGAWYQVGERQQLHLIVHSESQTMRENPTIDTRDGHFALRVKDFDRTLDHLKKHNITCKGKKSSRAGFSQIFCCDPSGNLVEFNTNPQV